MTVTTEDGPANTRDAINETARQSPERLHENRAHPHVPTSSLSLLSARHLAELRKSGLSDEIITAAGLRSIRGEAIRDVLGWSPKSGMWGDVLLIPFRDVAGNETAFARVKPDFPRSNIRGKAVKYESPRNAGNRAYFPPDFQKSFLNSPVVLITEGEKKTLAAAQAGFCCIGLVGVWGFQAKQPRNDDGKPYGSRLLLTDLAGLMWVGKTVVILFDSDVADRPDLQLAEFRLAELLIERGASVRVARLPNMAAGIITGMVDMIVHHGDDGPAILKRIVDAAIEPRMPSNTKPMDVAHMLVRAAFTGKSGKTLRRYQSRFWRYDGRRYVEVPDEEMTSRVLGWLYRRGLNADPVFAGKVVRCLGAVCLVPDSRSTPCWLDGENHGDGWVSFENGLFAVGDRENMRSLPHTARYFTLWSLPYQFDPDAKCPTWLGFLNEVLDGDAERIDLLQRIFGLMLTPDTSYQKVFLLVGPPRSGKGTVCRTLIEMIGHENVATPALSNLGTRFGLASLLGATAAILPDAHLGKNADGVRVAEILKSISGEDPQNIDRKHLPELKGVRLSVRFVVTCNELARFTDPSGALADRLCVVPFRNTYLGREDRTLGDRLLQELSGIVNWAIVGLARLRMAGRFNVPERSKTIMDGFRRLSSPMTSFMEECVETHPDFEAQCEDLFHAWIGWCQANGNRPGSSAKLGEQLRSVNPKIERERRRKDGTRPYHYTEVKLNALGERYRAEGFEIAKRWERRDSARAALGPEEGQAE